MIYFKPKSEKEFARAKKIFSKYGIFFYVNSDVDYVFVEGCFMILDKNDTFFFLRYLLSLGEKFSDYKEVSLSEIETYLKMIGL